MRQGQGQGWDAAFVGGLVGLGEGVVAVGGGGRGEVCAYAPARLMPNGVCAIGGAEHANRMCKEHRLCRPAHVPETPAGLDVVCADAHVRSCVGCVRGVCAVASEAGMGAVPARVFAA